MAVAHCGLDIGARYTKLVATDWRKDVIHATCVPTPYHSSDTAAPAGLDVDRLLQSLAVPLRALQQAKLATCIHSGYVAAATVSLPPMPRKEIAGAGVFEAKRTMIPPPGAGALFESIAIGAHTIKKAVRSELLVLKAERQGLDERLEPLKQAGLIPRVITTSSFALLNALAREDLQRDHLVMIHFGAATLDIIIAQKGKQRFFRSVSFGCRHLLVELAQELGISEEQAEQWLLARGRPGAANEGRAEGAGAVDPDRLKLLTQPYVERLVNEIRRSLAFYTEDSGQRVETLLLSGGGMLIPNLPADLNRGLGGEIQILDPFQHARTKQSPPEDCPMRAPLYAAAYGLAQILHEPLRRNEVANFLPFELKQRQQRTLRSMVSLQLGFVLMAAVILLWLKTAHRAGSLSASIAAMQSAARSLQPFVARQREHEALRQQVQERLGLIRDLRNSHPSGAALLRDIARSVPEGILLTTLVLEHRQTQAPGAGRPIVSTPSTLDEGQPLRSVSRSREDAAGQSLSLQPHAPGGERWMLRLEGEVTDRYEAAVALAEEWRARLAHSQHLREVRLSFPPLEKLQPTTTAEDHVELVPRQRFSFQMTATIP